MNVTVATLPLRFKSNAALPNYYSLKGALISKKKWASTHSRAPITKTNGECENRTHDLVHAKHALYQLS